MTDQTKPAPRTIKRKGDGLTDAALRALRPEGDKPRKVADKDGLYVLVTKAGGRLWRWTARINGKQDDISYGAYPDLSLAAAREKHQEARRLVAQGIHPRRHWEEERKRKEAEQAARDASTFKVLAEGIIAKKKIRASTREQWHYHLARLEPLHDMPVSSITKADLISAFERLWEKPAAAARSRSLVIEVFHAAEDRDLPVVNAEVALRNAVATKPETKHAPAVLDREGFGGILRKVSSYPNDMIARALMFIAYTATRSIECRTLEWSDVDFPAGLIVIPATKMKMNRDHVVPISRQVRALLAEQRDRTEGEGFVFRTKPAAKEPLARSTLYAALRFAGIPATEHSPHGFRSTFSTHCYESGLWSGDAIELSLAHVDRNATRAAYNRASRMEERARLMQWWADECDMMRRNMKVVASGNVLTLGKHAS